jgi:XRE family transcriptional regulator, regulator of sulfur utilization
MRIIPFAVTALASAAIGGFATLAAQREIMRSRSVDWASLEARPTKYGLSRRVFQAPTARLDELEMHITTLNPGEAPHPPHQHVDEELMIIKEGTVESTLNGVSRRVGPGGIIFQASNEVHGIRNPEQTPATYYVIKWTVHSAPPPDPR